MVISSQLLALLVLLLLHWIQTSHVVIGGHFRLHEGGEGIHSAVRAIVRRLLDTIFEESKHGEGLDFLLCAKTAILDTIYLNNTHRQLLGFDMLSEGLPDWLQTLTPDAPWSVKVNKGVMMILDPSYVAIMIVYKSGGCAKLLNADLESFPR